MIQISDTKRIREELNLTHLVIFGIDKKGKYHVATHGCTEKDAKESAKAGNTLKKMLNFPEYLCNEIPMQRVCNNCTYYYPYYGIPDHIDNERDFFTGDCCLTPVRTSVHYAGKCMAFQPTDIEEN